jgi:hypothetical protein
MPKAGFELAITASERSKTVHASDRSVTAAGSDNYTPIKLSERTVHSIQLAVITYRRLKVSLAVAFGNCLLSPPLLSLHRLSVHGPLSSDVSVQAARYDVGLCFVLNETSRFVYWTVFPSNTCPEMIPFCFFACARILVPIMVKLSLCLTN